MAVHLDPTPAEQLLPVPGVAWGIAEAGIRKANRKDLAVMLLEPGASVGGVFTRNRYCAAPVQVCREHLAAASGVRALVINTGCANAGTGEAGLAQARRTCRAVADRLGVDPRQVLPFSTGVIMEQLPGERIEAALPTAIAAAANGAHQWALAAQAIMTTDTVPKARSVGVVIGGQRVAVTGIAKGAGMIRPDMATMLGYVATDACVDQSLMASLTRVVAEASFNRVTVDGDTSTNDSFIIVATNKASHAPIRDLASADGQALVAALVEVARWLAQAIVRDGEGATKFIAVRVDAGANAAECLKVAYSIAHSPLVKTAFFASDPNLGRILAAVGYAGIDDLDQSRIELFLDDVHVVTGGGRNPDYREADGSRVMKQSEITIRVDLGRGRASETVWTCDFSYDYVRINADYRS